SCVYTSFAHERLVLKSGPLLRFAPAIVKHKSFQNKRFHLVGSVRPFPHRGQSVRKSWPRSRYWPVGTCFKGKPAGKPFVVTKPSRRNLSHVPSRPLSI